MGTPGDRGSNPVEDRFKDALERRRAESEDGVSMDETLSETGEEMELAHAQDQAPIEKNFTTHELLQDLSGDDLANTATPPLGSPRKDLKLPLPSKTSNEGMILLSAEESKKRTFEGNKWMFLGTLDEKAWQEILGEFNQKTKSEATLEDFKEELWSTVVKFGEPLLMGTGLDEKARKELLSKVVKLRETEKKTRDDEYKVSSTLKQKTDVKMIKIVREDKVKTSKIIKDTNMLKAREGDGKSWKGRRG